MGKLSDALAQFARNFEPRIVRKQGKLTDVMNGGSGDASVTGRPGYVWVDVGGAIAQVRAPALMPVAELPVEVSPNNADGIYQVTNVNYTVIQNWDGSPFTNRHGTQHHIDGGDPVYIDQRQLLIGLLREQATPDTTAIAGQVFYLYNGAMVEFPETTTADLTAYNSATVGYSKWVTVSVDAATNTLQYTAGSEFLIIDDAEDFYPTIPENALYLGDVRLEQSTATITQDMIDGRRRSFLEQTFTTPLIKRVVSSGNTLVVPTTFAIVAPEYFTVAGTLTLQGDAELRII